MGAFEAFLLAAVERAPFLVGDAAVTPRTVKAPATVQGKRAREEDTAAGGCSSSSSDKQQQQQAMEDDIMRLQRILVDGPLQPLGAEHLLYHILLPAFRASMKSAEGVWHSRQALAAAAAAASSSSSAKEAEARCEGSGNMNEDGKDTSPACIPAVETVEHGGHPRVERLDTEALQRALSAAQAELRARQESLEAAYKKARTVVGAITQRPE